MTAAASPRMAGDGQSGSSEAAASPGRTRQAVARQRQGSGEAAEDQASSGKAAEDQASSGKAASSPRMARDGQATSNICKGYSGSLRKSEGAGQAQLTKQNSACSVTEGGKGSLSEQILLLAMSASAHKRGVACSAKTYKQLE
ncbi:uncharacterized protein PSFLO_07780 [Pseudozyma flocculosa]|uniref:Uncharacterized protein n=1 Tax=Pseudozyma flocculosa TaxID=84751 RepID=A0A5C3FF37_9BASI|nr:uncharacterized protein PSFLO_07780 [Pseudozyma flocculosa]